MKEYFPEISEVKYEGKNSTNPYAYKFYKKDKVIGTKTAEEHLKFSLAYWHTLT